MDCYLRSSCRWPYTWQLTNWCTSPLSTYTSISPRHLKSFGTCTLGPWKCLCCPVKSKGWKEYVNTPLNSEHVVSSTWGRAKQAGSMASFRKTGNDISFLFIFLKRKMESHKMMTVMENVNDDDETWRQCVLGLEKGQAEDVTLMGHLYVVFHLLALRQRSSFNRVSCCSAKETWTRGTRDRDSDRRETSWGH